MSTQVNAQKITTAFDKKADFTKYKSLTFLGWQKGSKKLMNDLDKRSK